MPSARTLVSQLDLVRLSGALIDEAADVGDAALPTLDAIHLASALSIRNELTAFVTYDNRLITAAFNSRVPKLPARACASTP